MLRLPKWITGVIVLAIGGIGVVIGGTYFIAESRLEQIYEIPDESIRIPTDAESINRGRHLVVALAGCQDCHGEDLSGKVFFDDPLSGKIASKNLTSGVGGVGATYTTEDWVRSIRHGVGPDGKPLIGIPANVYNKIADDDLGAIIAFLKSLPPVDKEPPPDSVGILTRLFILLDPSILPAQVINHDSPPHSAAPDHAVTQDYGRYLAIACTICHGDDFSGKLSAGAGLNLTAGGDLANWTEAEFIQTLRTGKTPTGQELNPDLMPWQRIGLLTDEELMAIWLYLESLPALQTTRR